MSHSFFQDLALEQNFSLFQQDSALNIKAQQPALSGI
jgi:hypothetical protein